MRCKTCAYPLWQLKPGPCPECGTPFKPSDFEFIGNSVRFCCPHCQQAYYGTGEKGFLIPQSFTCVSCNTPVTMDEMILQPTEGVSEEQTKTPTLPWIEKGNRSWFGAFFATMGWSISNPNRAIDGVPPESSAWHAIRYALVHTLLQGLLGLWPLFLILFAVAFAGLIAGGGRQSGAVLGIIIGVVIGLMVWFGVLLVWMLAAHATLRITGSTEGGFRRTVHAMAYSAGNNFISAIPCLGFYLCWAGFLWWGISGAAMLARAQKVAGWRAGLAVFALPIVFTIAAVGLTVIAVTAAQRSASSAMKSMPASVSYARDMSDAAEQMQTAIRQQVIATSPWKYPVHAVWILHDNREPPNIFVLPRSKNDGKKSLVAGHSIDQWSGYASADDTVQQREKDLWQAWPTRLPAHRVGDWVFVYEGQDASKPKSRLWVAIGWYDPAHNPAGRQTEVPVVFADGSTDVLSIAKFDAAFKEQNEERALERLPQIPHPKDVLSLPGLGNASNISNADPPTPSKDDDANTSPAAPSQDPDSNE